MKNNYITDKIGNKYLYDNEGRLHSSDDMPAVILESGECRWYYENFLHREEQPAINIPGYENQYYHMGERHRDNGPAVESIDSEEYWINGNRITKEQWLLHKKLELKLVEKNSITKKNKI